jgi:hypothetical protein
MNIKQIQSIVGKNLNEIQKKNYLINNNTIFDFFFTLFYAYVFTKKI